MENGKTSVDLNDEIKTGIDVIRIVDEDKKPNWIEKMIDYGNNKGKKRLPIAKRLELINKMIKSGKAGHAGYHNPDKLKPEIEEFIESGCQSIWTLSRADKLYS